MPGPAFGSTNLIEDVDGAVVFRQACVMGLEGIVAKLRDSRHHLGRSRDWIKIKNMAHPAVERAMLIALSKQAAARRKWHPAPSQ